MMFLYRVQKKKINTFKIFCLNKYNLAGTFSKNCSLAGRCYLDERLRRIDAKKKSKSRAQSETGINGTSVK